MVWILSLPNVPPSKACMLTEHYNEIRESHRKVTTSLSRKFLAVTELKRAAKYCSFEHYSRYTGSKNLLVLGNGMTVVLTCTDVLEVGGLCLQSVLNCPFPPQ